MGLEEARTYAHDSNEWEEGSREGILGCQPPWWRLRGRVLSWGRGWLRPMWSPCQAQPLDNVGVLPISSWTHLIEAGYFQTGLCRWGGDGILRQSLGLWEQGSLLEPEGGGRGIAPRCG